MAQPIRCDIPGHDHLADVLFSRTDGSVSMGMCDPGFLDFATQLVAAAQGPEDAPSGPEGPGEGSDASPRPRGRSRRGSVPVPAVDVTEVDEGSGPGVDATQLLAEAAALVYPEPDRLPEPEPASVEA